MSVEVESSGPVFDGRAERITEDIARLSADRVATTGVGLVRDALGPRLKHPTGRYMASIHALTGSWHEVTDDNQVYGPWLEGVGSRNRTTRFKGYNHWRRAAQQLDREAAEITETVVSGQIHRLEG